MLNRFLLLVMAIVMAVPSMVQAAADLHDNYKLKEMVVLSRHNIRSPLSGNGSALGRMTPHEWFKWTSAPSELSLRGGELETMMGQYFRLWLVNEGVMPDNYIPEDGAVRFYANSMQRTIATAQYFSSGMLPVANVTIEHKFAPSKMDPVFNPQLTFVSEAFRQQAMKEISAMGGEKGLVGIEEKMQKEFALVADVLDLKKSEMAREDKFDSFRTDDLEIILNVDKEPAMKGSLKLANSASDAFILQYYEEPDAVKAAFGKKLSNAQWESISRIKDVYGDVLFTAPSVAVNVAHPLLKVMSEELSLDDRKFTFLCGHDSNIGSVLAALDVKNYELPNSIEKKTPIGSKVVMEKWQSEDGSEYVKMSMVYQSTSQLRDRDMLTLENPPMIYPLEFNNMEKNEDGLYKLEDVQARFQEAIDAYDRLPKDAEVVEEAAA